MTYEGKMVDLPVIRYGISPGKMMENGDFTGGRWREKTRENGDLAGKNIDLALGVTKNV